MRSDTIELTETELKQLRDGQVIAVKGESGLFVQISAPTRYKTQDEKEEEYALLLRSNP